LVSSLVVRWWDFARCQAATAMMAMQPTPFLKKIAAAIAQSPLLTDA